MSKETFENGRWQHNDQSLQEKHKMALDLLKEISSNNVCDIACGDGFFLSQLTWAYKIGIDFSQVAIDKCKTKGIQAHKVDIEKEDLPFKNKEFDVAFLIDVLEHTWLPEELLRKANRISKHVIVTVPNFSFLKDRLQCLFGVVPQSMGHKKGHCYWMNLKELTNVCEQAGLEIVKLEAYYPLKHTPFLGTISYYIYKIFPNSWATSYAILLEDK